MISILLPTRKRPENIVRLWESIAKTADNPLDLELICYIDEDDTSYDNISSVPMIKVRGPRIVLSEMWNKCYEKSHGDILMHCGDDIVFRTKHWDRLVKSTFKEYKDGIVFVYGNDGSGVHDGNFGTHGFISRRWADTVGYFVPPYFSSDWNDTWLNDVAKLLGRHVHIDILTEHMHPDFGKADLDITHQERIRRGSDDKVWQIYQDKRLEREADAYKLQKVIDSYGG